MDHIEIIASKPDSTSSSSLAQATAAPVSLPSPVAAARANHNQNNKGYAELHFNAVNKSAGNGTGYRNDRNANSEENRRLMSPVPAPLQLSKKFVVMPATTITSATPSPTQHSQASANGSPRIGFGGHLKSVATDNNIVDSSSTDPSSTTSPIGTPAFAGARPKHFQSMRSIRSGRNLIRNFYTYISARRKSIFFRFA